MFLGTALEVVALALGYRLGLTYANPSLVSRGCAKLQTIQIPASRPVYPPLLDAVPILADRPFVLRIQDLRALAHLEIARVLLLPPARLRAAAELNNLCNMRSCSGNAVPSECAGQQAVPDTWATTGAGKEGVHACLGNNADTEKIDEDDAG